MKPFDFVVIGAGSAGFAAAQTAGRLGARVAVIDNAKKLGGLCILRGCMPTKTLLESSHRLHEINRASEFGLRGKPFRPNHSTIFKRKEKLIKEFADYRANQLKKGPFQLIRGHAHFLDSHHLQVKTISGSKTLTFKKALIATGSLINYITFPGLEETGYITSDQVLEFKTPIKTLAILGGGAVAVEFAQYFARLGTKVVLIQRSHHILHELDDDLTDELQRTFAKEGIQLFVKTQLLYFQKKRNKKIITFLHHKIKKIIQADEILYALGRKPNLKNLSLENVGLKLKDGQLKIKPTMQTQVPHIYAAGDAAGLYEIVHMAVQQGEIAAKNAVQSTSQQWNNRLKMSALFTEPQIAFVGSTEKELQKNKTKYLVARYFFKDHGKALIHGFPEGFVKLMCHPTTGLILGGAIIGPSASELIHEITAVMNYRGTVQQLANLPHYHPTLAEIITYPAEELADKIQPL